MMKKMATQPRSVSFSLYAVIALCSGFGVACSSSNTPENAEKNSTNNQPTEEIQPTHAEAQSDHGKKLTEIAGQATIPHDSGLDPVPVPEHAKVFIGRFHANVKCDDHFIPCKEGNADFILNLLPDGTVHRSIIQFGKVFADKAPQPGNNVNYRKDTWTVDQAHQELVVHRKEGVNFYYKVIDENRIVMDLDKIRKGIEQEDRNQELFSQGYPEPQQAYELVKDQ